MASNRNILDRKDEAKLKEIDATVRDKWSWDWMQRSVDGTLTSECIRKIELAGKAFCEWCNSDITLMINLSENYPAYCLNYFIKISENYLSDSFKYAPEIEKVLGLPLDPARGPTWPP